MDGFSTGTPCRSRCGARTARCHAWISRAGWDIAGVRAPGSPILPSHPGTTRTRRRPRLRIVHSHGRFQRPTRHARDAIGSRRESRDRRIGTRRCKFRESLSREYRSRSRPNASPHPGRFSAARRATWIGITCRTSTLPCFSCSRHLERACRHVRGASSGGEGNNNARDRVRWGSLRCG